MNKIKMLILSLVTVLTITPIMAPAVALAAPKDEICEGIGLVGGTTDCKPDTGSTVDSVVKAAINLLSLVVGVISVIMIIIGGLKYIMSSGDSNNINSAKNTILYALIGLVIVAFAQILVKFVLSKV